MPMITQAKFATHQAVNSVKYGSFVVTGHRWSESIGEHIYGVVQIDNHGERIGGEIFLVESALVGA
jgi:hypothetical protein